MKLATNLSSMRLHAAWIVACLLAATAHAADAEKITFDDHAGPLFRQKCASCHNPDKKSGGLDLTNYTNLMQGGSSGTVIEPGDPDSSYLWLLVSHQDSPEMPPESEKLPTPQLELIEKWINGGALENKGSKPIASRKPKLDLALADTPTGRPEDPAMPLRMILEPSTVTARPGAVTALATSPWAPLAAVAGQKQVLLYDTKTLQLRGVLPFPEGTPQVLKFSRNGELLLAAGGRGGASGKAIVWSVRTGERVIEVGNELDAVLAADISADQSRIALGGPQKVVRIYSTANGELLHELRKHTDWITSIEFSPDGVLLSTADRNGGMFVWEAFTAREYLVLKGHSSAVTGMSWRVDSNILATCSQDSTIRLWEMEGGREAKRWNAHGGGATSVEFARDGRLVSTGRDRVAKLWQQDGKQLLAFEAFGDIALRTTICDESNRVIAGDWTGKVRVWNAADGKALGELAPNPPPLAERLASAQQALAAAEAKHKPLAEALAAAQNASTQAKAAWDKAQTDLAKLTAAATKAVQAADAAKKQQAAAASQHQAAAAQVAKLAPVAPLLVESLAKAEAAVAKAAGDKQLAELVAQLKQATQARSQQLADANKLTAAKLAEMTAAKTAMDQAVAAAATADAAAKAMQAKLPAMEAAAKQSAAKVAAAQTAAAATAAELAGVQKSILKWQDEINFAQQLKELTAQLETANQLYVKAAETEAEHTAAAEQAVKQAGAAKQAMAAAEQAKAQAAEMAAKSQQVADAAKAEIAAVQQTSAAAEKNIAAIQSALAPLAEAAAKTLDAAGKAGDDAELKQAAQTLKDLATKKTEQMKQFQAEAAKMAAAAKQLQAKLGESQTQVQAAAAKAAEMDKQMAAQAAAMKAAEAKIAAAKKLAEQAAVQMAEADSQAKSIQEKIAATRSRPLVDAQAAK